MTSSTQGGRSSGRGYLLQAVVCLFESFLDKEWDAVELEPDAEQEKVDLRWTYSAKGPRVVQVKSRERNALTKPKAEEILEKLLDTTPLPSSCEVIVAGKVTGPALLLPDRATSKVLQATATQVRVSALELDIEDIEGRARRLIEDFLYAQGAQVALLPQVRIDICWCLTGHMLVQGHLTQDGERLLSREDFVRRVWAASFPPTPIPLLRAPASPPPGNAIGVVARTAAVERFNELVAPAKGLWNDGWYAQAIEALQKALEIEGAAGTVLYARARYWLWLAYVEFYLIANSPNAHSQAREAAHDLAPTPDAIAELRRLANNGCDVSEALHYALAAVVEASRFHYEPDKKNARHLTDLVVLARTRPGASPHTRALAVQVVNALVDKKLVATDLRQTEPAQEEKPTGPNTPLQHYEHVRWECALCHLQTLVSCDTSHWDLEQLACAGGHLLKEMYQPHLQLVREHLRLGRLTQGIIRLENARAGDHRLVQHRGLQLFERTFPLFDSIQFGCPCGARTQIAITEFSPSRLKPTSPNCPTCLAEIDTRVVEARTSAIELPQNPPHPTAHAVHLGKDQLEHVAEYNVLVRSLSAWYASPLPNRSWKARGRLHIGPSTLSLLPPDPPDHEVQGRLLQSLAAPCTRVPPSDVLGHDRVVFDRFPSFLSEPELNSFVEDVCGGSAWQRQLMSLEDSVEFLSRVENSFIDNRLGDAAEVLCDSLFSLQEFMVNHFWHESGMQGDPLFRFETELKGRAGPDPGARVRYGQLLKRLHSLAQKVRDSFRAFRLQVKTSLAR